ncbi:MAG: hypothetical protein HeimC3_41920 [Candidatus Heimdallarchaeota archaeon LC_3]|nr:MAG: hypothetical protein HeimC3_41920 [Candidatus Heimdallarchaeota archaeon LC_3]
MALKKGILIIECIPEKEGMREGRIVFDFLSMVIPEKIEFSNYTIMSYEEFYEAIESNNHQFIHISSHGNIDENGLSYLALPNRMKIYADDLAESRGLTNRNLLITACDAGKVNFLNKLFEETETSNRDYSKYPKF